MPHSARPMPINWPRSKANALFAAVFRRTTIHRRGTSFRGCAAGRPPASRLAQFADGLSAYFLKDVAPEWYLKDIYLGLMQFMVIRLVGLALVFIFPAIATWLPHYIYRN